MMSDGPSFLFVQKIVLVFSLTKNLDESLHYCLLNVLVAQASSAFHPVGVGKRVPASAGKAKADMVYSVRG